MAQQFRCQKLGFVREIDFLGLTSPMQKVNTSCLLSVCLLNDIGSGSLPPLVCFETTVAADRPASQMLHQQRPLQRCAINRKAETDYIQSIFTCERNVQYLRHPYHWLTSIPLRKERKLTSINHNFSWCIAEKDTCIYFQMIFWLNKLSGWKIWTNESWPAYIRRKKSKINWTNDVYLLKIYLTNSEH